VISLRLWIAEGGWVMDLLRVAVEQELEDPWMRKVMLYPMPLLVAFWTDSANYD